MKKNRKKWDVLAAHGSQKQSPKLLLNADSMKVYVTLQRVNKNGLIWRCCDRRCSGSHEIKFFFEIIRNKDCLVLIFLIVFLKQQKLVTDTVSNGQATEISFLKKTLFTFNSWKNIAARLFNAQRKKKKSSNHTSELLSTQPKSSELYLCQFLYKFSSSAYKTEEMRESIKRQAIEHFGEELVFQNFPTVKEFANLIGFAR